MALSSAALEAVFQGTNELTEAAAATFMASQFTAFFLDATVVGAPAVGSALVTPEAAFVAAIAGMSQAGQGAARLQAAIIAYWTSAMAIAPTIWPGAIPVIVPLSGIIPPTLGTIAGLLTPVFASNIVTSASQATASASIAAAIFATQLGATVTLAPPPPGGTPLIPVL